MKKSGASIVIEALCRNGVQTVFGYPGGAVLPIYDELYKNAHRINHVLCAHEQNAAHAADGFARVTGKPGVVIATSGPGATNLVTGIANAYLDSVPLVAITGNVAVPLLGRDSFQEVDITGITREIVKHNFAVSCVQELSGVLDAAFEIASSGRPGPVLVDIPKSIQTDMCDEAEYTRHELFFNELPEPDLTAALAAIAGAERPLIYAGGGVVASGASAELQALAEKISAPIAFSMMGLTALPAGHPANLGMCGMHGSQSSAKLQSKCDLIIAIGVRFSDRATGNTAKYKQGKKLIHIDIDNAEISKNTTADFEVCGDVKQVLQKLLNLLPQLHNQVFLGFLGLLAQLIAQMPLQHLRRQVAFQHASYRNGNCTGLFGHDNHHCIRSLTHAHAGPMTGTQIGTEPMTVGQRQHATGRNDSAAPNDHSAIVQRCLREENVTDQLLRHLAINLSSGSDVLIQGIIPSENDQRTNPFPAHDLTGHNSLIDHCI